ncbi:MAG: DUF3368 domain-containing protein [Chloroflexota bacterium]
MLEDFYERVTIPIAVWHEVVDEGKGRSGALEIEQAQRDGWIEVLEPKDKVLLRLLKQELHDGEAEVIALALEERAEIILLDESDARKVAELFHLRKTGIIGLLIRAKLKGLVVSLRQELDRLQDEGGFWIDNELYQQALRAAGEGGS